MGWYKGGTWNDTSDAESKDTEEELTYLNPKKRACPAEYADSESSTEQTSYKDKTSQVSSRPHSSFPSLSWVRYHIQLSFNFIISQDWVAFMSQPY